MRQSRILEDQYAQQVAAAYRDAVTNGGRVSGERLDELTRLQRLVDMAETARARQPWRRWAVAIPFLLTLAAISVLLVVHRAQTDIELEVTTSAVDFELDREQRVAPAMRLETLAVSGLQSVTLPEPGDGQRAPADQPDHQIRLEIAGGEVADDQGTITLDPLDLPAHTRVQLRAEPDRCYALTITLPSRSEWKIAAVVNGRVTANSGRWKLDTHVPRQVVLVPEAATAELNVKAPAPRSPEFSDQLSLAKLALERTEDWPAEDRPPVSMHMSTITSGTLFLESLNSQEYKVRHGELLRLTAASPGVLRSLKLDDRGIVLRFHGSVRELQAGSEQNPINLMPTLLDSLRARHSLGLLWATVLYVSGVVLAVLRWLRVLQ